MAKTATIWGIDIGNCALKALRCRPHETDDRKVVVEAFDYVEYPQLLSQPDSDREELIREALTTFLSRNDVKGDRVALAVPGQSGLARFIKLPPVETKKIPDIVKYEARQQIPFALEDVVWDYETLAGGSVDEGFALETEIGLFAMKRDQLARSLEPLQNAGIEIDYIQLTPLAVYNYACFDRIGPLVAEDYRPDAPPAPIVLLSIGVDTTDLVVTNGYRVWQRNIPLGGSHFTKALTKELKLTFSKAEHLKRNATKAEDPKAVFQAMRPVFSDLSGEIQRSLGFYASNHKTPDPTEVVLLGNAAKLPGLQRYLAQNLDLSITGIEDFEFSTLVGGSVTAKPAFEENRLSFAPAYGLCLQGLGKSEISTNLLPAEIVTQRLIRAKKPWAAAAAAVLLAAMAANYAGYVGAWSTVDPKDGWEPAFGQSNAVASKASSGESENSTLVTQFEELGTIATNLQSNRDGKLLWIELLKAIDAAMPRDERPVDERLRTAEDVTQRTELHISSMDCQQFEDLSLWFTGVQTQYEDMLRARAEQDSENEADKPAEPAEETEVEAPPEADAEPSVGGFDVGVEPGAEGEGAGGPAGPGWVIQLTGYHFHNDGVLEGERFVRETLIENLENGTIELPDGPGGQMIEVSFKELGIDFPVVVTRSRIVEVEADPDAEESDSPAGGRAGRSSIGRSSSRRSIGLGSEEGGALRGAAGLPDEPELWKLRRYDFIVQFVWKPTPRTERQAVRDGESTASTEESFE
ncbi:type IV pilus assembly protein PilM [Botrimarina hoheduenensis]|nr:type IV pilus assembly protein PilM [Botrimarina hoheduenensis]